LLEKKLDFLDEEKLAIIMNVHQLLLFENKENLQDLNIGKALL